MGAGVAVALPWVRWPPGGAIPGGAPTLGDAPSLGLGEAGALDGELLDVSGDAGSRGSEPCEVQPPRAKASRAPAATIRRAWPERMAPTWFIGGDLRSGRDFLDGDDAVSSHRQIGFAHLIAHHNARTVQA